MIRKYIFFCRFELENVFVYSTVRDMYINDIADNTQSFSRLFADDTSLLYSSNNINEIEVIVNSDLSKIYNGSKEWLVDFNQRRQNVLFFLLTKQPISLVLSSIMRM